MQNCVIKNGCVKEAYVWHKNLLWNFCRNKIKRILTKLYFYTFNEGKYLKIEII